MSSLRMTTIPGLLAAWLVPSRAAAIRQSMWVMGPVFYLAGIGSGSAEVRKATLLACVAMKCTIRHLRAGWEDAALLNHEFSIVTSSPEVHSCRTLRGAELARCRALPRLLCAGCALEHGWSAALAALASGKTDILCWSGACEANDRMLWRGLCGGLSGNRGNGNGLSAQTSSGRIPCHGRSFPGMADRPLPPPLHRRIRASPAHHRQQGALRS